MTMNKILNIAFALAFAVLFVACNPIEKDFGTGEVVTSADQLNVTLTPVMFKTYKTNKYKVQCKSPVVCKWSTTASYISNDTTVLILGKGAQNIKLTAMAADGSLVTKTYSVTVDSLYYPVPAQWGYLCGSSSKTWVWATDVTGTAFPGAAAGKCYGNGGYLANNSPGWWTCGLSDLTGWGVANDKMTFSLDGASMTLVTGNTQAGGKGLAAGTYGGTFSFDMSKTKASSSPPSATNSNTYAIGQLTLSGVTVSLGYQPNVSGYPSIYTYDILYLDNNIMVLEAPEPSTTGAWGTAWFWVFKRQGYSF